MDICSARLLFFVVGEVENEVEKGVEVQKNKIIFGFAAFYVYLCLIGIL